MSNEITIKDENTGKERTVHTEKTVEDVAQNLENEAKKCLYCPKCKTYPDNIITRAEMKVTSEWDVKQETYVETDFDYKTVHGQYCGDCSSELEDKC